MKKQEIAASIRESLRRELLESQRLEWCEDHDFITMLRTVIDDMTALGEKFDMLLQSFLTEPQTQEGLYTWTVYLERADEDSPARPIGPISGNTVSEALERAAQLYEYPPHDLIVRQVDQLGELHPPIDSNYHPVAGDVCVLKLWVGPYSINRYDGTKWEHKGLLPSEQEVTTFVKDMRYMGDGRYYRPQSAE